MSDLINKIPKNFKGEYQTLTIFPSIERGSGIVESNLVVLPQGTRGLYLSCRLTGSQGESFEINIGLKRFLDVTAGLEQGNIISMNDPGIPVSIVYLENSQLARFISLQLITNTSTNCKVDIFPVVW